MPFKRLTKGDVPKMRRWNTAANIEIRKEMEALRQSLQEKPLKPYEAVKFTLPKVENLAKSAMITNRRKIVAWIKDAKLPYDVFNRKDANGETAIWIVAVGQADVQGKRGRTRAA